MLRSRMRSLLLLALLALPGCLVVTCGETRTLGDREPGAQGAEARDTGDANW